MTTQTIEFNCTTGLDLTCKLFAVGTDVVYDSATATEKVNHIGRYYADFTDVDEGIYLMTAFLDDLGGFANEKYTILSATATYYPYPEINVPVFAVIPATATSIDRVNGTTIAIYVGEICNVSVSVTDMDNEPVDLTGMTLQLVIEAADTDDIAVVANADISVAGSTFTFAIPALVSANERLWYWVLRNTDENTVEARGVVEVNYAPTEDV